MASFIVQQKPYGKPVRLAVGSPLTLLTKHGRIFCPYYHGVNYPSTAEERYQQYLDQGYKESAKSPTIKRYHDQFMSLRENSLVIVPHRSYNDKADKNLGYLLRIGEGGPRYETIEGFSSLFLKVTIINTEAPVRSGIMKSILRL